MEIRIQNDCWRLAPVLLLWWCGFVVTERRVRILCWVVLCHVGGHALSYGYNSIISSYKTLFHILGAHHYRGAVNPPSSGIFILIIFHVPNPLQWVWFLQCVFCLTMLDYFRRGCHWLLQWVIFSEFNVWNALYKGSRKPKKLFLNHKNRFFF